MSVEEAIADRLAANAGVAALVGTRVWQLKLPQRPVLPAVKVQLVDEPTENHLRGAEDTTFARVQVDCYGAETGVADPYGAVADVAEAVNAALCGTSPVTIGDRRIQSVTRVLRRAMFEAAELRLVRITQDFEVVSETV